MMITRQNMCRFERLVSKLFAASDIPKKISIENAGNVCRMIAAGKTNAIMMTVSGSADPVSVDMPWSTVKEIVTRKVGLVEFNVSKNSATVSWENNGIPQQKPVDFPDDEPDSFPALPSRMGTIAPELLDAIVAGSRCVDPDNTKYSLGSVCLRSKTSQVLSTDGRQAFIQDGYAFPWEGDVLCPVSKIFASKELRESSQSVKIGADKDWLAFEVDNVVFWMKPIDGKYPTLDQFHRNIGHFTWLRLDPTEAAFVAGRLSDLPGAGDRESPIYLELGDNIAVRGHDVGQGNAVEIRMPKSRVEGKRCKVPMNRKFLKNAIDFGSTSIGIDPDDRAPLICTGDGTMFIIMPLEGDEPKAGSVTTLQTDRKAVTPVAMPTFEPEEDEAPVEVKSKTSRAKRAKEETPVMQSQETVGDHSKSMSRLEAIAEAEQLHDILKDATGRARNLIRQLKGGRKHERDLLRREQELDKERQQLDKGRQRLLEAATLIGKV